MELEQLSQTIRGRSDISSSVRTRGVGGGWQMQGGLIIQKLKNQDEHPPPPSPFLFQCAKWIWSISSQTIINKILPVNSSHQKLAAEMRHKSSGWIVFAY